MRDPNELNFARDELIFAKDLWKLVLETEELVRNHYMKLAEKEIYDLYDDTTDLDQF